MTSVLDAFDPDTWSDAERYYFAGVNKASENTTNMVISNGKPQHAVYLIEKFFREARRVVRLFTGRLSRSYGGISVYTHPRVVTAAVELLQRPNSKLTVVMEKDIDIEPWERAEDHPVVKIASEFRNNRQMQGLLEIRKASPDAIDVLRRHDYCYHWMIMDNRAYRLETDTELRRETAPDGDSSNRETPSDPGYSEDARINDVDPYADSPQKAPPPN